MSRHPTWRYLEPTYLVATAWVSAAQGRTSEASDITARAAEFAFTHGQPSREVLCLQTAVQFGDTECAGRLAELATHVQGPRAPLSARYARALAAADAADLDAVSREFEAMGDVLVAPTSPLRRPPCTAATGIVEVRLPRVAARNCSPSGAAAQ